MESANQNSIQCLTKTLVTIFFVKFETDESKNC